MTESTETGPDRHFPSPDEATTAVEFVRALRQLRSWSGLTYRQVEARAQANGDVLPYSTLATALRRDSLPRRELVSAFVRACGGNPDEVVRWLERHDRLSAAPNKAETDTAPTVGSAEPVSVSTSLGRVRAPRPIVAVAAFVACAGFLLFALFGPQMVRPPNVHWYTIRTMDGTCLDITGKDDQGNPLVVEKPCKPDPKPEQRFAWENLDGVYRISAYNPDTNGSTWCTGMDGQGRLRLQGCVDGSETQLFRLEPTGGNWRIRPAGSDACFGLVTPSPGTERVVRTMKCADARNQTFTLVSA